MTSPVPFRRVALAIVMASAAGLGCGKAKNKSDAEPAAENRDADPVQPPTRKPRPAAGDDKPLVNEDGEPSRLTRKPKAAGGKAAGPDLGEDVLAADAAPADAPLRPLPGMPVYRLTNVRIGNPGPGPSPKLMAHYERVSGEERGTGPSLVIRTADGNEHTALGGFGPFAGQKKAGDYVVDLGFRGGPGRAGPPKDVEVYLVHTDRRWEDEGFRPRFKVSNSAVMGDLGRPVQFAREWKADEAEKLNNPPPAAPAANANNTVGEDTPFVGFTEGLLPPLRYADKTRPVIGLIYSLGDGDGENKKRVKCVVHLTPAYDKRQPRFGGQAAFAKPGYALGGLNVKTNRIVTAVQPVFMKLKPDNTLDPADSYTGNWIGTAGAGDKEGKLTTDGRRVAGLHLKHFGTVHAVALVLD